MLFDLRGRGRRRTVQGVYLGLAILIFAGLVLFGVGSGVGGGGLFGGITSSGGGGNQNQVVSAQEQAALKAVRANPNSSDAWSQLVQARWSSAGQGNNYNTATGGFTATGKKELAGTIAAWERYLKLTNSPDANLAILAARAYAALANYGGAASAWEIETTSNPTALKGFECLAVSAYAAKQTRKGDLALAKALALVPKPQRTLLKTQISTAKTQPAIAQQC